VLTSSGARRPKRVSEPESCWGRPSPRVLGGSYYHILSRGARTYTSPLMDSDRRALARPSRAEPSRGCRRSLRRRGRRSSGRRRGWPREPAGVCADPVQATAPERPCATEKAVRAGFRASSSTAATPSPAASESRRPRRTLGDRHCRREPPGEHQEPRPPNRLLRRGGGRGRGELFGRQEGHLIKLASSTFSGDSVMGYEVTCDCD